MLNTTAACPIKKTHKIKEKLHNKDCTRYNYGYQNKKGGIGGTCSMDDKTKNFYITALPIASKDTRANARPDRRRDNTALSTQLIPQRLPP